jgi:hypothetical protein
VWSHRWNMGEGASADKLIFQSLGDQDIECNKSLPRECRNAEVRTSEINANIIWIQCNGAGELEYDQRAIVPSHS